MHAARIPAPAAGIRSVLAAYSLQLSGDSTQDYGNGLLTAATNANPDAPVRPPAPLQVPDDAGYQWLRNASPVRRQFSSPGIPRPRQPFGRRSLRQPDDRSPWRAAC